MIRSALRRIVPTEMPAWAERIPDVVWLWLFETTADEARMQRAFVELQANPTITVYDFRDGQEFNRRPADPLADIRRSMGHFADGLAKVGETVNEMLTQLGDALQRSTHR